MSLAQQELDHQTVSCVCGTTESPQEVFRTPMRRYVRCPTCALVYLSPRPMATAVEDYYRESYDDRYGLAEAGPERLPVFRSVFRHLSARCRVPGKILDIGCGDGAFLELCRVNGWTCTGLELSKKAAERATRRGFRLLPMGWIEEGPHGGAQQERYDAITLINVLETVTDPSSMLRRVRASLMPGGIMMIRVSNGAFHLAVRRPVRWIGARYQQAFHLFVYSPMALSQLVRDAGFRILSIRNSVPSAGLGGSSAGWLKRLPWVVSGMLFWTVAQIAFRMTWGRAILSPSFELVATPLMEGKRR